jgi:hypothetical protein
MAISILDKSFAVDLQVFVGDTDGTPATGKTVQVALQRKSDGQYWDWASSWVGTIQWTNSTEVGDGVYQQTYTTPSSTDQYTVYWRETTIPAYTASDFIVDDLYSSVDDILVDTAAMQPLIDQSLSTTESNIRGSDSDDLKDISDQIDNLEPEVQVDISMPSFAVISVGNDTVDGAILAGASSVTVDNGYLWENSGYVLIDTAGGGGIEYMHYTSKSGDTLSGLTKGLFGTADAGHADGVVIYQVVPVRVKLTIHDAGVPLAPNSTPTIAAVDLKGTSKISSVAMTQEGSEVGIYYYDILVNPSAYEGPEVWEIQLTVEALSGKTNKYRRMLLILDKPSSTSEVFALNNGTTLRVCTQDGYINASGVLVAWTDAEVGYMRDDDSNRILAGEVRWYLKPNGTGTDAEYPPNPPAFCKTDVNGDWVCLVPPGTFEVNFYKSGLINVNVERTVA